jgi:hypothetical protein
MANKQYVKGTQRERRASKISTSSKNTKKHRATIPYETYQQQKRRGNEKTTSAHRQSGTKKRLKAGVKKSAAVQRNAGTDGHNTLKQ